MPTHAEKKILPYRAEQLYALVADVASYPEFLPWCMAARVRERQDNVITADLVIGYKIFRERFTSVVTLTDQRRIDVAYHDGPFSYLDNHWIFTALAGGTCEIDFYVDFAFRSSLLQTAINAVFNEAVKRMIQAFEKRAADLYGATG